MHLATACARTVLYRVLANRVRRAILGTAYSFGRGNEGFHEASVTFVVGLVVALAGMAVPVSSAAAAAPIRDDD